MLTLHVGLYESDFSGRSVLGLSSNLVGSGGEREEGGDGGFHEHRERDMMCLCLYVSFLGGSWIGCRGGLFVSKESRVEWMGICTLMS
jgi:hypothetical protein